MKKFISMVMAAAMVVSLVPATAFASTAVFKVQGAHEWTADYAKTQSSVAGPEVQIAITDIDTKIGTDNDYEVTLEFDNIEFNNGGSDWAGTADWTDVKVYRGSDSTAGTEVAAKVAVDAIDYEDTSVTLTIWEDKACTETGVIAGDFKVGDVIVIPINSAWALTSKSEGTVGTVTVSGAFGESEAMPVASVLAEGLDVTVQGKPQEVAEEEVQTLKTITIKSVVGNFKGDEVIKVKIDNGFEFTNVATALSGYTVTDIEEDEFKVAVPGAVKSFTLTGLKVEAVDAKAGDVGSIIVSCKDFDGDSDEAIVVIADAVIMSVDEDADVPEMYSGVNRIDTGLTSGTDNHKALEVTIEESVAGAWDAVKGWNLELPEGVYVAEVAVDKGDNGNVTYLKDGNLETMFRTAYKAGDYENFEFSRRDIKATDDTKAMKFKFQLTLIAEPEFTGDVTLTLTGDAFEEAQEVVIAKFVAPYTVEAAQNDLVIDYKETVVPTAVVITEAEEGLWNDGTKFTLKVEDIDVEDSTITVNEDDSDMVISEKATAFTVKEESDDAAAVVTMDGIELMMWRDIPAGAYDLMLETTMGNAFLTASVYGDATNVSNTYYNDDTAYNHTVKEGFVNVITAGRDQDDASFTKKVVVPVGAMEIVAGEDVVALDVPAYINAAGYTMLPVRAVAVALGINTNNVIWDQATKTVTILYGQRIITMTVGQKVINVNGSAIPASAAVEVVNGRTFLGLRDLATALGVVDITWDAATQTATLNGGNK